MINKIEEIKQTLKERGFENKKETYHNGVLEILAVSGSVEVELTTYDFKRFTTFKFYPKGNKSACNHAINIAKDVCETYSRNIELLDKYLQVYNETHDLMIRLGI